MKRLLLINEFDKDIGPLLLPQAFLLHQKKDQSTLAFFFVFSQNLLAVSTLSVSSEQFVGLQF